MDYFIDWSCRLANTADDTRLQEAARTMKLLSERFRVTHFCIMPEFNADLQSVPMFLLRVERTLELLRRRLPSEIKVRALPRAYLTEGLHRTQHLNRLLFSAQRYLPLLLPLGSYEDWMDREINALLFQNKYRLMLTSCELIRTLYPAEIADKLFRIQNAVYQFHFHSFTDETAVQDVRLLLSRGQTVLMGTGLKSLSDAYYYEFSHYQETATKKLSAAEYQRLLHENRVFWSLPRR